MWPPLLFCRELAGNSAGLESLFSRVQELMCWRPGMDAACHNFVTCQRPCGDTAQVKKALGWEPKVPLREGLARMVDDFTKRCGAPTQCKSLSCKPAAHAVLSHACVPACHACFHLEVTCHCTFWRYADIVQMRRRSLDVTRPAVPEKPVKA